MCLGQSGILEFSEFGSNARALQSSESDPVGRGISICVKAVTATSTTTEFTISPDTVLPPRTIINVVLSISVEGLCENSKAHPPPWSLVMITNQSSPIVIRSSNISSNSKER